MSLVGIIPARGGSRGLPRKNVRTLGGRPIIAFTIEAALGSRLVERVIVSTDSPVIARIAEHYGAEVPGLRPAELSGDTASSADAVLHMVELLELDTGPIDAVVTLQPTSPFRSAKHIDAAVRLMTDQGSDSAVSVARLGLPTSVLGWIGEDGAFRSTASDGDVRRQAAPAAVRITGGIYVSARALLGQRRLLGSRPAALLLDGPAAMDIDTLDDLAAARREMRRRRRR